MTSAIRIALLAFSALGLLAGACQSFERTDDGRACLLGGPPEGAQAAVASPPPATDPWPLALRTLDADVPLTATVVADFGDCDEDRELSCSVRVEGDRVVISSRRAWTLPPPPNGCLNMAIPMATTCDVPPLGAGVWRVVHGGTDNELVIPSVVADPCLSPAQDAFPVATGE
jgi:hypothetical protein